jgi:dihydrofolate reductase
MRKLILYIAMSLDGYIAQPDDNIDFLSVVEKPGEDYGYKKFIDGIDTVLMGRRTYDKVLTLAPEYSHSDKKSYIITRTTRKAEKNITFYNGNLTELVSKLKEQPGLNIFVDGGAELVCSLLDQKLIDEMIISVIPVLLGDGIRLFMAGFPTQNLELKSSQSFGETGLVQLHYAVI